MFWIVQTVFNVHMIMNHDYFGKEIENHTKVETGEVTVK